MSELLRNVSRLGVGDLSGPARLQHLAGVMVMEDWVLLRGPVGAAGQLLFAFTTQSPPSHAVGRVTDAEKAFLVGQTQAVTFNRLV